MSGQSFLLLSVICTMYSGVNLAYYIVHANGKKYVRLFSALVLFVFSVLAFLRFLGELNQEYLYHWVNLILLLPVLDTIVDWQIKLKNKGN